MDEISLMARHLQINYRPTHLDQNLPVPFSMSFDPPADIAKKYGSLYLYFEAEPGSQIVKPATIVSACGKAFYQKSDHPIGFKLKTALRALNELTSTLVGSYYIGIIAVHNQKVLLANTKDIRILLARSNKARLISTSGKDSFSEITEGRLSPGDRLIMTGPTLAGSLGDKNLIDLACLKDMSDIEPMLKRSLKLPEAIPYSLIVIDTDAHKTKELKTEGNNNADSPPQGKQDKKQLPALMLATALSFLKAIKRWLVNVTGKTKRNYLPSFLRNIKQAWTSMWTKYVNPNPRQAIIVVIITTIIVIGLVSISVNQIGVSNNPTKQLDNAVLVIDSAKEALSNNNQQSGREYLEKSKALLDKIPQSARQKLDSLAEKKQIKLGYSSASQEIQALLDRIENVTRIDQSNSFEIGSQKLSAMIFTSGSLYGVNGDAGSIIEISPLFGAPQKKAENADLKGAYSITELPEPGFALLGNSAVWQYSGSGGLTQIKANGIPKASAISSYLNNLYFLSPQENQVVRATKSGLNLISKTNMLRNVPARKLNGTNSLAVFGNIFVAKDKGILLFEQGEERSFRINNLPSSFGNIKSIYYNASGNYFLALNSNSTRLAQIGLDSDSAVFKKSFALNNDAIISSFAIDQKTSQIFVNSGSKIISFNLAK